MGHLRGYGPDTKTRCKLEFQSRDPQVSWAQSKQRDMHWAGFWFHGGWQIERPLVEEDSHVVVGVKSVWMGWSMYDCGSNVLCTSNFI